LLHHIWSLPAASLKFPQYTDLIESVKITPRETNTKFALKEMLLHLTSVLNININIIGFKRSSNYSSCNKKKCHFPYYIFQNTLVKLLRQPSSFPTINIVYFATKYHVLTDQQLSFMPYLLDKQLKHSPLNNLIIENENIMKRNLLDIISDSLVHYSFNVIVYSTYTYVKEKHNKILNNNIIGIHFNENCLKTLHIFIAPGLNFHTFNFYTLDQHTTPLSYLNSKNKFSNKHFKEEYNIYKEKCDTEKILNQEHCICDHPNTQQIFLPDKCSYNLGIHFFLKISAKNLLKKFFF